MPWIGKLIGGALGWLTGNIFFVGLGILLGHQFDKGMAATEARRSGAWFGGMGSQERQQIFFETTFRVMGGLAKVDGHVSETEVRSARSVMQQMRLGPEEVRRAIALFTEGRDGHFEIDIQLAQFYRVCRRQPVLIRTFLEILLSVALSEGPVKASERELLTHVAGAVGVSRVELARLEAVLRARQNFSGRQQAQQQHQDLGQAYRALGIDPGASDREVKTAYRRLMNRHHPDKLVSRGLPESMMEVAKEKTREIRSAYEVIKEDRGIR
jgi:DnaJ like chaperone protein